MRARLSKRLPEAQAILQVYAVSAVLLSAWTVTAFLWKLSAWLLLLDLGEILTVFSYAMAANLLESLLILLVLLTACVLLPPRFLRDDFVARGTIFSLGVILSLMAFIGLFMRYGMESVALLLLSPLAILLLMTFLLLSPSKLRLVRFVNSAAVWISDRLIVFLFILLPTFVILTLYVVFRNVT
jgi:hypothetical protein